LEKEQKMEFVIFSCFDWYNTESNLLFLLFLLLLLSFFSSSNHLHPPTTSSFATSSLFLHKLFINFFINFIISS